MRSTRLLAIALLSLVTSIAEAVTITSVNPSSGATSGGTVVTIKGTDFGTCSDCSPAFPPFVRFGNSALVMSQMLDSTTLVVTTPPHPAGTVTVHVEQWDGVAELPAAFTFVGDFPQEAMERILLPLLTRPVFGRGGSEFHTDLRIEHRWSGQGLRDLITIYGLQPSCPCLPTDTAYNGLGVDVDVPILTENVELMPAGSPGRFMYVDESQLPRLTMNLRVHDVSRPALNFGTEMPIVRERDFVDPTQDIVLVNVPTDARFRNTLRIYGTKADRATITVEGEEPQFVELQGGSTPFEPAYAIFGNFPVGTTPRRVTISLSGSPVPPEQKQPYWAFITVTNNETQVITTITPQP
jgi:hypothetical protein